MAEYSDRFIECAADELRIRWYYFPFGTKRVPYSNIRALTRLELSALRGKGRIWGTGNLRYWANLDPARPRKKVGITLDVGKRVQPFITPDDPDAVIAILRAQTGQEVETSSPPFI